MKLHLLGASGSGVTTLGQALAAKLKLIYFDSDDYFWLKSEPPYTQRREPADRNRLIIEDLNQSNGWILGGSIIHWGNVFPPFDLVVFLYLPQEIRNNRLRKRELERYREALLHDPERRKLYEAFISWASDYDHHSGIANRTLQAHRYWLSNLTRPVLERHGDLTVNERMKRIIDKLKEEQLLSASFGQ